MIVVEVAPYWNVNLLSKAKVEGDISVEVAPYWNVNSGKKSKLVYQANVEVAPYWNVNIRKDKNKMEFLKSRSSSILECK